MARARDECAFPVKFYMPERFERVFQMPTKGELSAIAYLLEADHPVMLKDLRNAPGARRITWQRIIELLGTSSLEGSDARQLTKAGVADGIFLHDCVRRTTFSA